MQIFKFLKLQFKPCKAVLHSFQTTPELLCFTVFTAVRVYQDTTFHLIESVNARGCVCLCQTEWNQTKKISISILPPLPGAGHCFPWLVNAGCLFWQTPVNLTTTVSLTEKWFSKIPNNYYQCESQHNLYYPDPTHELACYGTCRRKKKVSNLLSSFSSH